MKAVVAAFNQEKALVGAFSVIANLRMELFEALMSTHVTAGVKSFVLNAAGFTCVTFLTGSVAYYATTYFTHGINRWRDIVT